MTYEIKFKSKYEEDEGMTNIVAEFDGVVKDASFLIGDSCLNKKDIHIIIESIINGLFNQKEYCSNSNELIDGSSFFERICEKITKKD